jgi:hypothetical protein
MADMIDPATVFSVQAWESEEAFRRHFEADYHIAGVREIAKLKMQQLEQFRFKVASWERGPGADLKKRVAALDAGVQPSDLPL